MSALTQQKQKSVGEPRRGTADSAATRTSAAGDRAKKDSTVSSSAQLTANYVAPVTRQIIGNYELGRVLATGDFDCRTRLCTHTTTGVPYVARVYDKDVLAEAQWMWARVAESIRVQRRLPKNRHVLDMVECFESNTSVYILMHLFPSINVTKLFTDPAARGELLFRLHAASRAALRGTGGTAPAAAEADGNGSRRSPLTTEVHRASGDAGMSSVTQKRTTSAGVQALQPIELAASAGPTLTWQANGISSPSSGPRGSLRRAESVLWAPDAYSNDAPPLPRFAEADDASSRGAGEAPGSPGSPGALPTAADARGGIMLPSHMPLTLIRVLFQQAVKGVGHLHHHHVAHTGIAPDHLLVGLDGLLRLSNMVSCCFSNPGERMHGLRGTRHTVAPEVLRGESYDPYLADAWALGVVLYFMLNRGRYPHDGASTLRHILHGHIRPCRPGLPPTALDLLSRLLQSAPEERLPVDAILAHPFFTASLPTAAEEDAAEAAMAEELHARQLRRSMAAAALLQRGQGEDIGNRGGGGGGGGANGFHARRRWGSDALIGDDLEATAPALATVTMAAAAAPAARREKATAQRRASLPSFGSGGTSARSGSDHNSSGGVSSAAAAGDVEANALLGHDGDFKRAAASIAGVESRVDASRRSAGLSTTRSTVRSPRANLPTFRFLTSATPGSPGPGGPGSIGGANTATTAPSSHHVPSSLPSPTGRRPSRGAVAGAGGLNPAEDDADGRPVWRPELMPSMEALEDLAARVIQYHFREVRRKQLYRAETRALVARSQSLRRGKSLEDPAAASITGTSTGRYVAQLEQGLMGSGGGVVLVDLVSPKARSRKEDGLSAPSASSSPPASHYYPHHPSFDGMGAGTTAKRTSVPAMSGAAASRRRTGGAASSVGTGNSLSSGSPSGTPTAPSRMQLGPSQRMKAAGGAPPSMVGRHSSLGSGFVVRTHGGSFGSRDLDDITEQDSSFPSGLAAITAVGTRGSMSSGEEKVAAVAAAATAAARGGLDARRGSPTMPSMMTVSQRAGSSGAGSVRSSFFMAHHGRRQSSTFVMLPALSGASRGRNGSTAGLFSDRGRGLDGLPQARDGEPCPLCHREPYAVRSIGIRPYAGTRFVYEDGGFTKTLSA